MILIFFIVNVKNISKCEESIKHVNNLCQNVYIANLDEEEQEFLQNVYRNNCHTEILNENKHNGKNLLCFIQY